MTHVAKNTICIWYDRGENYFMLAVGW